MKWAVLSLYLLAVLHVHFRGRVRLSPWRQLFDHSSFVAPMNAFLHLFSGVPSTPFLALDDFPELRLLAANWETIRDEGLQLQALRKIRAAQDNDDAGFNSFFKKGWKRFYLKWYEAAHPSAKRCCPRTVALLRRLPGVRAAMFAELPAGAKLNRHRDPFAGSLRYHLGLATPNSERCFIEVDGVRYSWRDGEGVLFDETFVHWAHNGSDHDRLILFCDVERPMRYRWAQTVNRWLARHLVRAASSPNESGDPTGGINRVFRFIWLAGQYRRRFKAWNRRLYYAAKLLLIVAAALAVLLW